MILDPARMPASGWTGNVGVPGGIPTNYTMYVNLKTGALGAGGTYGGTFAVGDGVIDDAGAINAALAACPDNQYVYLPAGTYRCNSGIGRSNGVDFGNLWHQVPFSIVLKGAGPSLTKIKSYVPDGTDSVGFSVGAGIQETYTISAGNTRGSTSITVPTFTDVGGGSNHPNMVVPGQWVIIYRLNADSGFDATGANGYMGYSCSQWVKVTSVTGSGPYTVNFSPALNEGHSSDVLTTFINTPLRSGIEDLYIERAQAGNGNTVIFYGAQECWVKNCELAMAQNWHIQLRACAGCEVRGNYIHDGWGNTSNQDYGTGMFQYSCNNLIEDNIYVRTRHAIMTEYGGQNNVFGYNYSKDEGDGSDYLMGDILTHGGNPRFNLWEGNVAGTIKWDYVLGGAEYNTAFRNQIRRKSLPEVFVACFGSDIQRNNHSHNLVGNVYETPPTAYFGTIRRWGSTGDDESSPDLLCQSTAFVHGELDLADNSITWDGGNADHALPNSYYLSSKPSWWDGDRFPAIGPDLPTKSISKFANKTLWHVGSNPAYRRAIAAGY